MRTVRVLALPTMPQRLEAERLELALQGADLALWDVDFTTGRTVVNARWYEMLGLPPRQEQGDEAEWAGRIHPDDRDRVLAAEAAHRQGLTPSFEATYRLRHADGRWIWVLDRGRVLQRDALGRAMRMCGTHLDITDRVLAEEALRRSEQDMQVTLQSIGDAVITTDARGRVSRMNPSAERMTGWPEHEAVGRPLGEVFHIVDDPTGRPVADPVTQVLARGETVGLSNDTRLIARDGRTRQIADSAAPIRRADGEVIGVVLVFSDVSGAYRVQRALRERERELALVVAQMPGLVSRVDREGRYQYASPGYERWFGRPLSDIVGRTQREVLGDARHAEMAGLFERTLAGEVVHYEAHVKTQHGERYVLGTLVPDLDDDGRVRGHFTFVTDISERRRTEEALQSVQRQLLQAQKLEALGTLAGGIAHDFNNMVAGILGHAELALQDLPPGHPATASLAQIQRTGRRARALVQQILSFSHGGTPPSGVIDLRTVVEETTALLQAQRPAGTRLEVGTGAQALPVVGDATQLHQVLLNLCLNAWQALPQGRGRVRIGADGDAAEVWLQVEDDGAGMDEATRARIFDPFFTTKPAGQGSGLGLAVVHGIVQAHQGRIVVRSEPGAGACFTLHFPRAAGAGALPPPEAAGPPPPARLRPGRGQHVLYVDDDEVLREVAGRLLQRAGWRVSTCEDAVQALALLDDPAQDVALLVSDLDMPGASGLALCAAVRRRRPQMPMLLSTGFVTDPQRAEAAALGVREVLPKARIVEDLVDAVARAL